jgi:G3E family GTPase
MNKTIPIVLLTGYLGSGKTTLINHILSNTKGIKFAVIVNDIGEVNIDSALIEKGGVVNQNDDSLIALQNGCICCSLKTDLVKQVQDIANTNKFDYIAIEASGICEPEPIAQTLLAIQKTSQRYYNFEICRLDCVVSVTDALRLKTEFGCGEDLTNSEIEDTDIENLIVQQLEFCNIVLLNKVDEVTADEKEQIKRIIHTLNSSAKIIETNYAQVDINEILNTQLFDFNKTVLAAKWIQEIERPLTPQEEYEGRRHHHHHDEHHHDEEHHHEHHHHHHDEHHHDEHCTCSCCSHHHDDEHHHHQHGDEYGISTFVYYRRCAFDFPKFDAFVSGKWDKSIIRSKGVCYFAQNQDMSYLFEQAGVQKGLKEAGLWLCTAGEEELKNMMAEDPSILRDWDDEHGDKMIKIVIIGRYMDKDAIIAALDNCLAY